MIDQNYKEQTSFKNQIVEDILKCQSKDSQGLNDFQKLPTDYAQAIPRVGITRFRLPILIQSESTGELRSHDAEASMYVSLNAQKNGVSMSRLCTILQQETFDRPVDGKRMEQILSRYVEELRDETDLEPIDHAHLRLKFQVPFQQKSLKSENWGWQYYPVELEAKLSKEKGFEFFIHINYEYSSTCPCSLSMAKQYEAEYREGKNTEGVGIGVPHSQRSTLKTCVKVSDSSKFFIKSLVLKIKDAIPTETQSLVKRADEQAFAILNGTHPMFVEHATKRIAKEFNAETEILDWIVQLEHLESLHSHNAAAVIYKGVEGGLREDSIF